MNLLGLLGGIWGVGVGVAVGSFFATIHMYWSDLVLSKRAPRILRFLGPTINYRLQGAATSQCKGIQIIQLELPHGDQNRR